MSQFKDKKVFTLIKQLKMHYNISKIKFTAFKTQLQRLSEIIETRAKNSIVPVATRNVKLFLKTIW